MQRSIRVRRAVNKRFGAILSGFAGLTAA